MRKFHNQLSFHSHLTKLVLILINLGLYFDYKVNNLYNDLIQYSFSFYTGACGMLWINPMNYLRDQIQKYSWIGLLYQVDNTNIILTINIS